MELMFANHPWILVTGASSGIGRATALLLNAEGARVIGLGRNAERLQALKQAAAAPERMFTEIRDLTVEPEGLPQYLVALTKRYGRLTGLAHCAGQSLMIPLRVLAPDHLRQMFEINCVSAVMLARGYGMARVNTGPGSAMVAVSSSAGYDGADPGLVSYAASKAAEAAALTCAARELVQKKVRLNTISPLLVDTPLVSEQVRKSQSDFYPLGLGRPEDIAQMIAFLLSDRSRWLTGANYRMGLEQRGPKKEIGLGDLQNF